jgi:hypothetical protein
VLWDLKDNSMKKSILFLGLIFMSYAYASDGSWTTTFEEGAPSCSLYRKRVANYYHRLNETKLASKAINANLSSHEIARFVELTMRTGVPLSTDKMAIWSIEIPVGEMIEKVHGSLARVEVTSSLFNWESDKFIFPSDVMNVVIDSVKKTLRIEMTMPFPFACLQVIELNLGFIWKDLTRTDFLFMLDKTTSDKIN